MLLFSKEDGSSKAYLQSPLATTYHFISW